MIYDNDTEKKPLVHKPIDVNSDMTPISQETVGQLRSDLWDNPEMSEEFLQDQLNIVGERLTAANNLGNAQMIAMVSQGLDRLNAIIFRRAAQRDN